MSENQPARRRARERAIGNADRDGESADADASSGGGEDVAVLVCEFFRFWSHCERKSCRRARACRGNADRCFDRFWPLVPGDMKVWFRDALRARQAGLSPRDACARADEAVAQYCAGQTGGIGMHDGNSVAAAPQTASAGNACGAPRARIA